MVATISDQKAEAIKLEVHHLFKDYLTRTENAAVCTWLIGNVHGDWPDELSNEATPEKIWGREYNILWILGEWKGIFAHSFDFDGQGAGQRAGGGHFFDTAAARYGNQLSLSHTNDRGFMARSSKMKFSEPWQGRHFKKWLNQWTNYGREKICPQDPVTGKVYGSPLRIIQELSVFFPA